MAEAELGSAALHPAALQPGHGAFPLFPSRCAGSGGGGIAVIAPVGPQAPAWGSVMLVTLM